MAPDRTTLERAGLSQESVDVDVRGLAAGGAGIADLPDGRVVFVPRTTEGDRARVRIERSRPRWARGSLVSLLTASPDRVEPACSLFAECGGCQLQHLAYEDQLRWKGRFVVDALTRIGGFSDVPVPEVVPSPGRLRYRNRVSYTLRRVGNGYVVAGFHALDRPAHVVDVADECLLPDERLTSAWMSLRQSWGRRAELLPTAGRLRLTLRLGHSNDGAFELIVEGGRHGWDGEPLLATVDALSAIWHVSGGRDRRDEVGDDDHSDREATLVAGEGELAAGSSFTQVNDAASHSLRSHVLERCRAIDAGSAVDAYCGLGAYGLGLASDGWTVAGIESERGAIQRLTRSLELAGDGRFSLHSGRVEDVLPSLLPVDLLILNPPRKGLHESVPEHVIAAPPAHIVYVSCDPATLARDLKLLSERYTLEGLRAFDLFPQTAHIETVAELSLRSRAE